MEQYCEYCGMNVPFGPDGRCFLGHGAPPGGLASVGAVVGAPMAPVAAPPPHAPAPAVSSVGQPPSAPPAWGAAPPVVVTASPPIEQPRKLSRRERKRLDKEAAEELARGPMQEAWWQDQPAQSGPEAWVPGGPPAATVPAQPAPQPFVAPPQEAWTPAPTTAPSAAPPPWSAPPEPPQYAAPPPAPPAPPASEPMIPPLFAAGPPEGPAPEQPSVFAETPPPTYAPAFEPAPDDAPPLSAFLAAEPPPTPPPAPPAPPPPPVASEMPPGRPAPPPPARPGPGAPGAPTLRASGSGRPTDYEPLKARPSQAFLAQEQKREGGDGETSDEEES